MTDDERREFERRWTRAQFEGDVCGGCARDAAGKRIWFDADGKFAHGPDCPYVKKHGEPRPDGSCGCATCNASGGRAQ